LVIDLQLFRGIRAIDERFGTVALEPGVTFEDLHAVLRSRNSRWFLPVTGGPPDGSVIGNLLQRGDGTGPFGDRARAFLDLEAVLQSGELVATCRDAAGPDISGLFFQSEAGVVTAVSLSLVQLPPVMTRFVMRLPHGVGIAKLVDAAQAATRDGILAPGAVCLWNGTKRVVRFGGSEASEGWTMSGAMHAASLRRAEADWLDLKETLAATGLDIETLHHETVQTPKGASILEGEPSDANLVSIMSGMTGPTGIPGFTWVCPVMPFDGKVAQEVARLVSEELGMAGIPPNLALGCRDARTIRAYIALAWDRSDTVAEARALQAHDRLIARFDAAGLPLFRLGQLSRKWSPPHRGDTGRVIERLLQALAA
jgi:4-cresol dehydrogenase (hydroxylating)